MNQHNPWDFAGGISESYERFQVPGVFEPLARMVLERMALKPGQRVLDVACGTGIVARMAAPIVGAEGEVVGVDLSTDMLKVAAQQAPSSDLRIAWRQGDATALPFANGTFDVVLCQQGLQFFPDKVSALREFCRVLAPCGRIAVSVWRSVEHCPYIRVSSEVIGRHLGPEAAKRRRAPCTFGDAQALRTLIDGAGFVDIEVEATVVTRRMLAPEISIPGDLASTPLGPEIAALGERKRNELVEEISAALHAYRIADGFAIPQGTHVALASKPKEGSA